MNELIEFIQINRELVDGNEVCTECRRKAFAKVKSPVYAEFYKAYQVGLNASIIFKVNRHEVGDAEKVFYNGRYYKIIRKFIVSENYIELTCSEII